MYQETKFLFILSLIFLVTIDTCRGQECDSVLAGSGTIISEGHPTEYPSYFDCKWTIEARSFDVVDISFKDFHIELGETCEFDSLEITAMGQRNKFCGTSLSRLPNNGRLRYRGRVELRMRSDDSVNLRGISLNYKVTPGEPPAETTPAPEISTPNPTTSPLTTTPAPILTCDDKPCQNEGECTMVDEVEFYCFCEDGFEGDLCEINIDDCASNPCKNGGTCVDGVKRWTCECIEGYIGETCGINFDDCRASPCKNGGTCEDRVNAFHCVCARGWTDYDCSIDIDECTPNPCKNYGVCENHLGYHSCICHPKYTGENCTISVEPTSSPPLFHPRTTVLPDEAAPLENPETTILPYEATPQEKTQNPTIGDGDSEETTSAPGITPDVTITTDLSTISSSTPAPTVGKLTDDTPGEEDDSLSLDLLPETEAPFDPAIESLPKEKEAKLQLTPEPHGDIEHVTKNPATNHSHQFPNATETPLGEGNVNGNETLLNTTSFPNESTETEDEESYFPTSIVATITTIATVGGLVGSVLYYCKSAFQSKKVEPSGRGQHSRAQRKGVSPIGRSTISPSSVDSGINSDGLSVENQKEKQAESKFLQRRRFPGTIENKTTRELLNDDLSKGNTSFDQPFLNQTKLLDEDVPKNQKTNENFKEEGKKGKKQTRKKKKSNKGNYSTNVDKFSPKPGSISSQIKLPPLQEDVRKKEGKNENRFLPVKFSPPKYQNQTPDATLFSFPKQNTALTHASKKKRKVANRCKGKRSKPGACVHDETAPRKKSLTQLNENITAAGNCLPQGYAAERNLNPLEKNFSFRQQYQTFSNPYTADSLNVDNPGRYFTPSGGNRTPPVFFADLPRKTIARPRTLDFNYEQNPMRQQSEHLYNISSSFPMHPFSSTEGNYREPLNTHVNHPSGHTSRTNSSTILSPARGRPDFTIEEAFESRNPRNSLSQMRPRTLSPLNFQPRRNDIPFRPFSPNQNR